MNKKTAIGNVGNYEEIEITEKVLDYILMYLLELIRLLKIFANESFFFTNFKHIVIINFFCETIRSKLFFCLLFYQETNYKGISSTLFQHILEKTRQLRSKLHASYLFYLTLLQPCETRH